MMTHLLPPSLEESQAILAQVAEACQGRSRDRPPVEAVVAALLQAEQSTRRQHQPWPFPAGAWHLGFTTGVKKQRQGGISLRRGFYWPSVAPAGITFEAPAAGSEIGTLHNHVQVGGLSLRLSGVCRYQPRKNLLAFDFTTMQVQALGVPLYRGAIRGGEERAASFPQRAIAQLPFFAFFQVTDTYIAARGRGGGLALWYRCSPSP